MPPFALKPGRMHEVHGASAHGFALIAAALSKGQVLWLREAWQKVVLFPEAVATFLPPERLLLATPANAVDLLAVAEEALKDASLSLVVLEITAALNLREGRRLQLAAKAGGGLGLCLLPEAAMGSNAAETRWQCQPLHDPDNHDSTLMHWEIIKNKSGTVGAWHVRWDEAAHHINMVPAPALRTPAARTHP